MQHTQQNNLSYRMSYLTTTSF